MLIRSLRALIALAVLLAPSLATAQAATGTINVLSLLNSQGSTTSGQKGVLDMGAVTTAAPSYTTGQTSPLSIDTAGNLRVVTSGSSGLAVTDAVAWTAASSVFTPTGGEYNTSAAPLASGQQGTMALTANRGQHVNLRGGDGREYDRLNPVPVSLVPNALPLSPFGSLTVRPAQQLPITMAGGQATSRDPALVVQLAPIPSSACPFFANISQTASATLVTPATGQRVFVCHVNVINAGTSQSVSLVEGTGAACGTGTVGIIGGTAASIVLAANGGFVDDFSSPLPLRNVSDNLCLLQSGATNVSGTITYALR